MPSELYGEKNSGFSEKNGFDVLETYAMNMGLENIVLCVYVVAISALIFASVQGGSILFFLWRVERHGEEEGENCLWK